MTGPIRDELIPPDPDPDGLDDGPPDSIRPEPDAYDKEEGYPLAIEDIAIVAWEAVRTLRQTQNGHTGPTWMHASREDRDAIIKAVQEIVDNPGAAEPLELEARLRMAVATTLHTTHAQ